MLWSSNLPASLEQREAAADACDKEPTAEFVRIQGDSLLRLLPSLEFPTQCLFCEMHCCRLRINCRHAGATGADAPGKALNIMESACMPDLHWMLDTSADYLLCPTLPYLSKTLRCTIIFKPLLIPLGICNSNSACTTGATWLLHTFGT